MRISLLVGALGLILTAGCAVAQTPTEAALPPGPLIVERMPDHAQWAIDYLYSNVPKPGEPSTLDRLNQEAQNDPSLAQALKDPQYVFSVMNIRPLHTLVTQTGEVTHEETAFEQNYKGEMWSDSKIRVEKRPNLPQLTAVINMPAPDPAFPGFEWLSKGNFTGIDTQNGHKCLVFQAQVDPVAISHPGMAGAGATVSAVAHIDLKTRYPVSLQFGVETRQYSILAPPAAQLVIPDDYLAAAQAMMNQIHKATPHLAAP